MLMSVLRQSVLRQGARPTRSLMDGEARTDRRPADRRRSVRAAIFSGGCGRFRRIVTDDDGGRDAVEFLAGHADAAGVLTDRFGIARLVDAHRADAAVGLVHDVAAYPAHAVAHLVVADAGRLGACGFELLKIGPRAGPADDVK